MTINISRWKHIEINLHERDVTVLSNGADGAGQFLKAMMVESKLFCKANGGNVPEDWSFFFMPTIYQKHLNVQDRVHLLAKMRTRILNPSNLLVLGKETACRGHIQYVFDRLPKEQHGLSRKAIDNKDK